MIEEAIEIRTPDGTSDGFLYRADGGQPAPGIIHLTDIAGIRPSHVGMAKRLAAEGYTVLLPNVFYRSGRPPLFDFIPQLGEERTMKRFGELAGPLTDPETLYRDAAAYVDFFTAHEAVAKGPIGVVGYCFTGAVALRVAATRPDKVAAAASFHGGWLYTDAPTSVHLVLPQVKAQLYFGHAIKDPIMPEEAIEKLNGTLAAWGGKYESEVYDGAYHGWTVPDGPTYNQPQAERAFKKLTELFSQALPR